MFLKNPGKFTMKQANIMDNFAESFTNNQGKNINKISDEIGNKIETVTTNSSINKKVVRQAGERILLTIANLIKDIANDFSAVEKTGPPIGKNWLT